MGNGREAHGVSEVRSGNDVSSPLQVIQSSINSSHYLFKLSLNQTQTFPQNMTTTPSLERTRY